MFFGLIPRPVQTRMERGRSNYQHMHNIRTHAMIMMVAMVTPLSLSLSLRVMRDVEAVRQEATLLKEQMHTVKEDIKKVGECVCV